ncbi:DNA repair protein RAD50 [Strongyloides ratti]|uniref:DNA repair protein RAD50 n=1 Tax=Strongyloides ratti TaxID=34506 RepID=A0A090LDJ2_STRRB|nr:DNA repair protein RAD50 [Strongyloides ratti]CEF67871.1 DNA repair protein RAD50 [Strongyloides ratti]
MVRFIALKIQGIRSVGDKPHVINFLDPLTLIQGENGTGKTTLIEALNYVTTGALPSGKMQAFIHNNRVAQKQRVDALVQLEFENVYGQMCTITKRMSSNIKGDKCTTKSDDFTMSILDRNGKEYSISSKVVDFNREVLKHLGVSKAILENVIFCHQEESCWPLGEPKELKTRFDEIFEVTKYVKAMENFKKLSREYESSVKTIEIELPYLETQMSEFLKFQSEFNNYKKIKNDLVMGIESVENENKRLQENLVDVRQERKVIEDSEKEFIDLNAKKVMLIKQIESTSTVEVYDGVKENLLKEIEELSSYSDQNSIEDIRSKLLSDIGNAEAEISRNKELREEIEECKKDWDDNMKKLEDLKAEKDSIWYRVVVENNICKKYEGNTSECLHSLKFHWNAECDQFKNSKEKILKESQENYSKNQFKFMEVRNLLDQITTTMASKKLELENNRNDLELFKKSQEEIVEVTFQLNEKKKELDSIDQEEINKIDEAKRNKRSIEDTIEILNALNNTLEIQSQKENEFDLESSKSNGFFNNILGPQFIYGKLYTNLKEKITICEDQIKSKQKMRENVTITLNDLGKYTAAHEAIIKKYDEESKEYKNRLQELILDDVNIIEQITVTENSIIEIRKKIGLIEGYKNVYEIWLEESKACNACPLCKSKFTSHDSISSFEEELNNKINHSPNELENLKKLLYENENILKVLKEADEISKKYNNLQICEIPKEQEIVKERYNERIKYLEEMELIENDLDELNTRLDHMKKFESEAIKLDNLCNNFKEFDLQVKDAVKKACAAFFPNCISPLTFEEGHNIFSVKEKSSLLTRELENLKNFILHINNMNQKKNSLSQEIQILTNRRMGNLESIQKINSMEEKIYHLVAELESLNGKYEELVVQVPELEEKVNNNKIKIEEIEKELHEYEFKMSRKLVKLDSDIENLENKENNINNLEENLKSFQYDEYTKKTNEIETNIKYFEELKSNLNKELLLLERRKDFLVTKQCQLNSLNLKDELSELEKKIMVNEYDKKIKDAIIEKEKRINNEIAKTAVEISCMKGELKETEKRLTELNRSLNDSNYVHVEKKLKQKLIRKIILKKAIRDLNLCYKVLDNSILKFHEDKMNEINLTLSELWKKVYTGNDIECIKIKSKENSSAGDKRKSYDYAVVMIVDGNEIEMRDRCSAGQRMLASILIRIALCEVFCHQCPIIALDEPTTNLDVNKVENISEMLTDLVTFRMNGLPSKPKDDCCVEERINLEESWANSSRAKRNFSNFQLIVITHDMQLTHLLYRNFKPEYIYQFRKESDGTSKITAHKSIQ